MEIVGNIFYRFNIKITVSGFQWGCELSAHDKRVTQVTFYIITGSLIGRNINIKPK